MHEKVNKMHKIR